MSIKEDEIYALEKLLKKADRNNPSIKSLIAKVRKARERMRSDD